jgi:nucleoside-diphosphate-sugar epimerase
MSQNVYITGISGQIGSHLGKHLRQRGYFVTGIDIVLPRDGSCDEFHAVDIVADTAGLAGSLAARDYRYVIHLAAIVAPTEQSVNQIFAVNVLGTYNVVQASASAGAPRLIYMSSESVLGFAFSPLQLKPRFVPITEEHPLRAIDPYGSSKLLGERIAALYHDVTGSPAFSLRPPWVWIPEKSERYLDLIRDPAQWSHGLWAYIIIDDLCSAVEGAMNCDAASYHAYFLAADDNGTPHSSLHLLDKYYHFQGPFGHGFAKTDSVISSIAARRFLHWEPRLRWRTWLANIRPATSPAAGDTFSLENLHLEP